MTADLAVLSRNYLLSYPDQREVEKQTLINSNSQSIFPLIIEAVHIFREFHPAPNLRDVDPAQIVEKVPQDLWIRYVVNPAVNDISELSKQAGRTYTMLWYGHCTIRIRLSRYYLL